MRVSDHAIRLLPLAPVHSLLAIDGPAAAAFNTIVEAVVEGGDGNLVTLALATGGTWVPNIGTLTLTGNAVDAETVTIGTTVYRWKNTLALAYDVKIGANAAASIVNLVAAINANGTAGTHYFAGTLVHPTARAYDGAGDTVVVHTNSNTILTAVGTLIATTETMTNASWGAATLADGTDGTNVTFVVTGNAIACTFAPDYSTVSDFEAAFAADATVAAIARIKTAGTTPLYVLLNGAGADVFSATAFAGGGSTASAYPTSLTNEAIGKKVPFPCDEAVYLIRSVAGSGTMTATVRLWGYFQALGRWYVLGTGSAQGVLNGGVAIGEISTSTNQIAQAEGMAGLRYCSSLYAEIVGALGGTATEIELHAVCRPPGGN